MTMIIIRRTPNDGSSTSTSITTATSNGSISSLTQATGSSTATPTGTSSQPGLTTSFAGARSTSMATNTSNSVAGQTITSIPAATSKPLGNAAIIGIVVGIVVCAMVSSAMATIAHRLRKQNKKNPYYASRFKKRLGQHKSESSDTLTSFDTVTENGLERRQKRDGSKPLVTQMVTEVDPDDSEKQSVPPVPLIHELPGANLSTASLPNFSKPAKSSTYRSLFSHGRGSSEPTNLYSRTDRANVSETTLSRTLPRAQTFSTLPTVTAISLISSSNEPLVFDSVLPSRGRLLSPILDSPAELKPIEFDVVPMSSTLSPARDSPHSLASLHTPSVSPSNSRESRKRRKTNGESPAISPLSAKVRAGVSPVSTKSMTTTAAYFDSKPLPPSPPVAPAPPPPFSPPRLPLSQPPRRSVPLRTSKSDVGSAQKSKTPVDGSLKPFSELYTHSIKSNQSYQHSVSEQSVKLPSAKPSTHISSLIRPSFGDIALQAPKPVLKLDTANARRKPIAPPTPATKVPYSASPATAMTATPAFALKSAPSTLPSQTFPFHFIPTSAILSSLSLPISDRESLRPLSNAATIASSRPPPTPSGPFELSTETEENRDSLQPLPLSFFQRLQSPLLSRSTTTNSSKLNTPSSASFLSVDPLEITHLPNSTLDRSPSVSVPIVFRFRMSRGKSLRRSPRSPHV